MSRRKFSDEFKQEAVALTQQSGVTQTQIARELGIGAAVSKSRLRTMGKPRNFALMTRIFRITGALSWRN